ncbi:recombinase family protein [Mobilicoccus caccae]|uniref:Resolvase/invertase-type recombinase catalytic domain-containing protein n=1 Tax=Mobilicoccus caccae TaxID=1859295 RepID=A0ABQ6IQP4_9MICO|nr:recombinase family protein [Mobilicoccus caccae]GMA40209.1 hypothetical protein GCM10025883_22540 [Mobilicoccus caccae]
MGDNATTTKALGYVRVSTNEQASSGLGLGAQRTTITERCSARGWDLVDVVADEGLSASTLRRPGLTTALDRMAAGEADVLVVAKLDRLSRSLRDFIDLRDRAAAGGWGLVILDVALDMSTPSGQLTSNVLASVGEFERALISARTRDALAEARKRGVRLGRPPEIPDHVAARIRGRRAAGDSLRRIAADLTADDIPTARGGAVWSPSSVQTVLKSER